MFLNFCFIIFHLVQGKEKKGATEKIFNFDIESHQVKSFGYFSQEVSNRELAGTWLGGQVTAGGSS